MDQDLRISLDPLVKLVIGGLGIVDAHLMTDHERRLGLAGDDQVPQIPIVLLDIALAGSKGEALNRKKEKNGQSVGVSTFSGSSLNYILNHVHAAKLKRDPNIPFRTAFQSSN